jgi:hypothetical protein
VLRDRVRDAAVLLAFALAMTGCAGATATPTIGPSDAADAVPRCPESTVAVATAEELEDALDAARPGDVIRLADGRYEGRFRIEVAGTADSPVWLCGSVDAVLDGGGTGGGTVLGLEGADHWRLIGFSVENGKKGVMVDQTSSTVVGGLTIRDIGDEAIHLRAFSSDNLIVGNEVSDTGRRRAEFGEGLYVGSAESNWCRISDCEPDRSDRNELVGNTIRGTTAEAIDIKEGTTGGVVRDNVFDGSALAGGFADSWVDVKGNDWLIVGNAGTDSPGDGFQTHEILEGWGTGNRFAGNHANVAGPGYGFALTPELGNVVECGNTVEGADAGFSNVECR